MEGATTSTPTIISADSLNIEPISPKDLYDKTQPCASPGNKLEKNILILDSRPFLVYNNLHILMSSNSMIPSIVKRRSRGLVPLVTLLPNEEKRKNLLSGFYDLVIVYDEDSDDLLTSSKQSNLNIVLRSLLCHCPENKTRFLEGGFSKFQELYPEMCVSQSSLCDKLESAVRISKDDSYAKQVEEGGPAEVLPYLYLGNYKHAAEKDTLRSLGVTSIVNVSKTCENHFPEDFVYKKIPVDDKTDADLTPWFNETISFIDCQRNKGGKVLVHCQAGVSRSATICVAYIMYKRKCSMDEAFDRVQRQRCVISPNLSFMRQLQNFEQNLNIPESNTSPSPIRPLLSPCRLSSNAPGFWCSANPTADDSYWGIPANSMVSPLLSPTSPFFSSPLLSPI